MLGLGKGRLTTTLNYLFLDHKKYNLSGDFGLFTLIKDQFKFV
tara:strand:- start:221 stop:349 length:129 start_codon:yes stop_codon:yes gene_type:complete